MSDRFTLALQFRVGWSPRSWRTWACPGTGAQVDTREGVKGKGGSAGDKSQFVMMQPVSPPSVWHSVVQVLLSLTCEKCVQTTDSAVIFGAGSSSCASTLFDFSSMMFACCTLDGVTWLHTVLKERWAWLRWLELLFSQLRRSLPSIADLTLIHSVDYFGTAWYHVVDLSSSTCYWFHKGVPPSGLIRHQLWSRLGHIVSTILSPSITSPDFLCALIVTQIFKLISLFTPFTTQFLIFYYFFTVLMSWKLDERKHQIRSKVKQLCSPHSNR